MEGLQLSDKSINIFVEHQFVHNHDDILDCNKENNLKTYLSELQFKPGTYNQQLRETDQAQEILVFLNAGNSSWVNFCCCRLSLAHI